MPEDWRALNRANWDERMGVHLGAGGYDLSALRAGVDRLDPLVAAELRAVAGLRVLHLQCHFGRDSLILAGQGAQVTGVDFSAPAIEAAQRLAAELGASARFVQADVYDAPALVGEPHSFDLVFATWGTITWLPDLPGWARVVAGMLRPGGALYFADAHPAALVFGDEVPGLDGRPGWFVPYFGSAPLALDDPSDYVDGGAQLANSRTVNWLHGVGAMLDALHGAGLRLQWLHEHPRVAWQMFRCLVHNADGL